MNPFEEIHKEWYGYTRNIDEQRKIGGWKEGDLYYIYDLSRRQLDNYKRRAAVLIRQHAPPMHWKWVVDGGEWDGYVNFERDII